MKKNIIQFLGGAFLVQDGAVKNWRFILFLFFLAIVMITASHQVDRKVMKIAMLNEEVQELRSCFVETRSTLMKDRMESTLKAKLAKKGLIVSKTPPIKIIIKN